MINLYSEDLERLKKNEPGTLDVALLQREILIDNLEHIWKLLGALRISHAELSSMYHGYYDFEKSRDVNGAVDLLEEVVKSDANINLRLKIREFLDQNK